MTKIAIVYYSTYGHVAKLANAAKKGIEFVGGVAATIYQVQETLPEEVLTKMHAPPKGDHPIATIDTLKEADGGGQETTAFTAVTFLAHQGMTYVPLGYRGKELLNMNEMHGGSPDGSRQPSKVELALAITQGKSFAEVTKKLAA
ncbi:hypothetical protein PInf_022445 [Phytophthora infestans]|nr:hypothetical protein PInf_022445 [Phytophthora infestans]